MSDANIVRVETDFWSLALEENSRRVMPIVSESYSGVGVTEGRGQTVGSSDIGVPCDLRVFWNKTQPMEHAPRTIERFVRGHASEAACKKVLDEILARHRGAIPAFRLPLDPDRPFRLSYMHQATTNPDNVIGDAPTWEESTQVRVIEMKSPEVLAKTVEDYWVAQTHYQMGIVRDNFPHLAKVQGEVWAVSMGRGQRAYGVWDYNQTYFATLVDRARRLAGFLESGTVPNAQPGLVCASCDHCQVCPAWSDPAVVPVTEDLLGLLDQLKEATRCKAEAEGLQESLRNQAIEAIFPAGLYPQGRPERWRGQIGERPVSYRLQAGRRTVDFAILDHAVGQAADLAATLPPEAKAALQGLVNGVNAAIKQGDSYPVLDVRDPKKPKEKAPEKKGGQTPE